jgi:multiple sugar transport system substrate-binding protein
MNTRLWSLLFIVLVLLCPLVFAGGSAEEEHMDSDKMMDDDKMMDENITLWTTEEQPERIAVQESIAADFQSQTGISVDVVPVTENQMAERVTAAFAAGELPDIIYSPLKDAVSWHRSGVLDAAAATDVINALGKRTFASGVLSLVEIDGEYGGVPVDGWTQMLVYRQDLFDEKGLKPPRTYADILAAAKALHDPPNLYGFVAATDPSQGYMMQVFEHVALANGAGVVDTNGNITVDTPQMVEAIEFYKQLADVSPEGNLFWQQSRELYLAGQAAMIIWSPFIMDELAGLRDSAPVTYVSDPTSRELAARTNFITSIAGPSNRQGAGWADIRYLMITVDASTEAAKKFVEFSMNDGYLKTLAIAPEGKFPVRRGDSSNAEKFITGWSKLDVGVDRRAPLSELYSSDVIANMVAGLDNGQRWAFDKGYGDITAKLYDTRVFAELIRQNIDGELSAQETASRMQTAAEGLR